MYTSKNLPSNQKNLSKGFFFFSLFIGRVQDETSQNCYVEPFDTCFQNSCGMHVPGYICYIHSILVSMPWWQLLSLHNSCHLLMYCAFPITVIRHPKEGFLWIPSERLGSRCEKLGAALHLHGLSFVAAPLQQRPGYYHCQQGLAPGAFLQAGLHLLKVLEPLQRARGQVLTYMSPWGTFHALSDEHVSPTEPSSGHPWCLFCYLSVPWTLGVSSCMHMPDGKHFPVSHKVPLRNTLWYGNMSLPSQEAWGTASLIKNNTKIQGLGV